MEKRERYEAIDGLRAISAIGIVMMHVRSNGKYDVGGFAYNQIIPSFTNLVFLFLIISSFTMCCSYHSRMVSGQMNLEDFYKKRYRRIWPYFAMLCFVDFMFTPSLKSLYEVFANLTLCFGFLPTNQLEVIGVGWFLGVIFVFYLIYPFFCFLINRKDRAWFSFGVALLFNILAGIYFTEVTRRNILYCAVYLLAGGLIYLYKESLLKFNRRYKWVVFCVGVIAAISYFVIGRNTIIMLVLYSSLLIYSIGVQKRGILINPVMRFLSSISMEIYLCHMIIYRIIEKLGLAHMVESPLVAYSITTITTIVGAIVFAKVTQWLLHKIQVIVLRF